VVWEGSVCVRVVSVPAGVYACASVDSAGLCMPIMTLAVPTASATAS